MNKVILCLFAIVVLCSCSSDGDETPDYAQLETSCQKVLNNIEGTWKKEAYYLCAIDSPYEKWGWNETVSNTYLKFGKDGLSASGKKWSVFIDYEFTLEKNDDEDYYPFLYGAVFLEYDGLDYMVEIKADGKLYLYNDVTLASEYKKGFPSGRYIKVN